MVYVIKNLNVNYLQVFIAACLNLSEVINGFGVAWSGPVLPKLDDLSQSPLPFAVTELQKTWIASFMFFGFIGAFSGGYLSNLIGRKKAVICSGVLHLATYVLLTFAVNLPMMYIGRFMVANSMCFSLALGMTYIGETASPNIRGIIMTSMGVSHASGSLLVYSIGPFMNYTGIGYVAITLNVVMIAASCFLPESPMFFVLKDDEASARSVLEQLGRKNDIGSELKAMIEKVQEQQNTKHIWKELFRLKSNRKSLFISVCMATFMSGSGIMAVIVYANSIFKYAGKSIQPDIASIIVAATFVVGTLLTPIFIDKLGRRILLLISSSGLCVTMTGIGVYFYLQHTQPSTVESLGWLPITFLVLAQLAYSFGLSVIPNMLPGELFSPKVRGLGSPITICSSMITGFISTTLFGYIVAAVGIHFTFWMFAIWNAICFIFVLLFVPETMGKSLMEIQNMLEK